MDLKMLEQNGIIGDTPEIKTILNVLIRRFNKGDTDITIEYVRNYIDHRREQLAVKRLELDEARKLRDMDVNSKPRPATKKDLNKSRGAVQTKFRRSVLGNADKTCLADPKSNCYEKKGVRSKASKEKKYNRGSDPDGWNTSSQGAGNVVGARKRKDEETSTRFDGYYL